MKIEQVVRRRAGIVGAVLVRPRLWRTATGVVWSHCAGAGKGWASTRPHLASAYLTFRMETQYGEGRDVTAADATDVLKYLEWVKKWKAER